MCKSRRFRPRARTAKVADLRMCKSRHFSVCTCVQSRHFSDPRRKTFVQVVCGLVVTRRTKLFVAQKFSDARTSLCDVFVSVAQMCWFGMCTHSANVHTFRAHVLKIPVRVTSTPGTCALPRTHRAQMCTAETQPRMSLCMLCSSESHGQVHAPDSFGELLQRLFFYSLSVIYYFILIFLCATRVTLR